jgi:hypothetical protein
LRKHDERRRQALDELDRRTALVGLELDDVEDGERAPEHGLALKQPRERQSL